MQNPFGASIPSPFAARQAFTARGKGSIGEAFWADKSPAYAWGQINITSGSFGSVSSLSGSSAPSYITSIVQTGGGGAANNGTCTFTFGGPMCRAYFAVWALSAVNSASSYTAATTIRNTVYGSANFFSANTMDTRNINSVVDNNSVCSFRVVQCTGAGQAVSITSICYAPNSGTATLHVSYLIYPLAWI